MLIFVIDQDDVNPSIICETSVSVRSVNLCGQDHVPSIMCDVEDTMISGFLHVFVI